MNRERALLLAGIVVLLAAAPSPGPADAREAAYQENNVGVGLLEQYNYEGAAAAFRRALEIDPGLAIARLNLSIALLYAPEIENARKEAEASLATLSAMPEPHYVLGLVAKSQNRAEDALA